MFLWGQRKRCVEQIAQEKGCTCAMCGSASLTAPEASWMLGAGGLDVYLKCSDCEFENPVTLSSDEYKRCGFGPNEGLPNTP